MTEETPQVSLRGVPQEMWALKSRLSQEKVLQEVFAPWVKADGFRAGYSAEKTALIWV